MTSSAAAVVSTFEPHLDDCLADEYSLFVEMR